MKPAVRLINLFKSNRIEELQYEIKSSLSIFSETMKDLEATNEKVNIEVQKEQERIKLAEENLSVYNGMLQSNSRVIDKIKLIIE